MGLNSHRVRTSEDNYFAIGTETAENPTKTNTVHTSLLSRSGSKTARIVFRAIRSLAKSSSDLNKFPFQRKILRDTEFIIELLILVFDSPLSRIKPVRFKLIHYRKTTQFVSFFPLTQISISPLITVNNSSFLKMLILNPLILLLIPVVHHKTHFFSLIGKLLQKQAPKWVIN